MTFNSSESSHYTQEAPTHRVVSAITLQQELALSPKSQLHWLGWDEDGTVITVDDTGIVRALVMSSQPLLRAGGLHTAKQSAGMWTPVSNLPNHEDLFHWVVGCTKEQMIFLECTAGDRHPLILPSFTPPLCSLPFSAPLLPETSANENAMFVARSQLQMMPESAELVAKQQQLDKSLLRLFHVRIGMR